MEIGRNSSDCPTHRQSKKPRTTHQIPTSGDGEIPKLPEEIIVEILTRLPVKSLLKFRCVSKSWLSVISSPQFIKTHLRFWAKDATFSKYRIMLTISDPGFNLKHCSVRSLMCEPSTEAFNIDYPRKHRYRAVWVVGSCNGLICIAINEKDLFLWNPSTRISTKLPPVEVKMTPGFYNIFGFGYNESSDDYKVLGIFCAFGNVGVYQSVVKLYSSKTNSWKRIEDFKGGEPLDDSGKFAGGKLHFSTIRQIGLDFRWDIVSLDLDTEEYGIVEQPNYGEGLFESSLGVVGGCICILCNYEKVRADFWVLKEYGIKESWTKVVSIPYLNDPGKFLYSKPLFMLPNGEILFVFGMHLVVYNPKDNCLRHPETSNLGAFLEADVYIESLVSPAASEV
ncbi:F-box/kelch-repeat protein [Sesamum alatum]|uniref:F-box/kelch-repeat protein n=1 Tax=Sesamum alatum TaxID=300844 RepID=A0AAE2CPV4_9LAMI|nr:F-box/kelch-repeat protein [Sesamum alatum]